jgi:acyl-CoA synthetase (AMP-forming)/AMP-acid ligase II
VATCNRCDIWPSPARSACRSRRPSLRSWTTTAGAAAGQRRRDRDPRPAGDGRLLEPPGRNGQGHDADGYFKTGDIGIMDENGYVKIVDRKKDMILVSGFNVYPNELEGVIAAHPGRAGMRRDRRAGRAFRRGGQGVRGQEGPQPDAEQLMDYCKRELTGYKKPKYIEFRTNCRRPTSARSCAARCARKSRQHSCIKNRRPREGGDPMLQFVSA